MNPLVSIVTPSYNQAQFLEHTIRSVLAQDYGAIEYLVVDGGSGDGSYDIIRRYADRLAWWVSEPDRGQAEALNKGLRQAQGEIVAWLNSDDVYLPGAISRAVAALQANPTLGLVFGDALTVDEHGRPLQRLTFGDWGLDDLTHFRIICQPAVFMRRTALAAAGYLDPDYHMMLDHHLWLRLALQAPIGYIASACDCYRPLAAARHHPAAKNTAQPAKFAEETLRLLQWVLAQPGITSRSTYRPKHVRGGAYRLAARYLLDGGRAAPALGWYARACLAWPEYAVQHAHRMAYAGASLAGLDRALDRLRQPSLLRRRRTLAEQLLQIEFSGSGDRILTLENWPGICLDF